MSCPSVLVAFAGAGRDTGASAATGAGAECVTAECSEVCGKSGLIVCTIELELRSSPLSERGVLNEAFSPSSLRGSAVLPLTPEWASALRSPPPRPERERRRRRERPLLCC